MTIKTTSIKLIYKGEVIKVRGTTDTTPTIIINSWKKLYPKHLFEQCTIETEDGKIYQYPGYYIPVVEQKIPTQVDKQENKKKVLKRRFGAIGNGSGTELK